MKAFLSHSSIDKEFVGSVEKRLTRTKSIFDKTCFDNGKEFEASILEHLDRSSIFVFFASSSSLQSFWCKYEIDEAFYRKLQGRIKKCLVFIIDEEIDPLDIPDWMRRALVTTENSPSVIARNIERHLESLSSKYTDKYFFGRAQDRERLEDLAVPIGMDPPKVISITGLPGYGRRTLIKRSVNEIYTLDAITEIYIENGDSLFELCAKLVDKVEPYSCVEELKEILSTLSLLDEEGLRQRIVDNLERLVTSRELPVFVDAGGLLDDDGNLCPEYLRLFFNIPDSADIYVILILTRKLRFNSKFDVPSLSIIQLSDKATKQLLLSLANDYDVSYNAEQINELSEYIGGYPPAAYFAIKQAEEYGAELLLSDKHSLVQFSTRKFIQHLQDKKMGKVEEALLSVLAMYSPLPLSVISALYQDNMEAGHDALYSLMDHSLVYCDKNGCYSIAQPVRDAAVKLFGWPSKDDLRKVGAAILEIVEDAKNHQLLDLSRILFRIGMEVKDSESIRQGVKLRSDYIRLVEDAYHQRDYGKSIEYAFEALKELPDNIRLREFTVRAFVQLGSWNEAEVQLSEMKRIARPRDVYFLEGFYNRKRGRIRNAIESYKMSSEYGKKGAALNRELAHCHMVERNFSEAERYIDKAIKARPENNVVLDIAANIYIKSGNEEKAREVLDKLSVLDKGDHYNLRLSTFLFAQGLYLESETAAKEALRYGGERFFAARVQLVKCMIRINARPELTNVEIERLDSDFNNRNLDVRLSLKVNFLLTQSKAKAAYDLLDKFVDKQCIQYRHHRKMCLEKLVSNKSIPYEERKKFEEELAFLSASGTVDVLTELDI